MISYPKKVILTEVGPRDGLQNEAGVIATADKIRFVDLLGAAGFPRIEVSSFVSPKWVPQLADAAAVNAGIHRAADSRYLFLVPNWKGYESAIAQGVDAIACFTAASETFTRKNINASIEESLKHFAEIVHDAKARKLWVRGYVSTAFGCPYEGVVDPKRVLPVVLRLRDMGVDEVSLGDTIGAATPKQVVELLEVLLTQVPADMLALHFHDTRGTALANVLAGLQMGIAKFDSSAGGLGGCPYAVGASGNLASEDMVYMLHGMGIETGVDLEALVLASTWMGERLGRRLPGRYLGSRLGQGSRPESPAKQDNEASS